MSDIRLDDFLRCICSKALLMPVLQLFIDIIIDYHKCKTLSHRIGEQKGFSRNPFFGVGDSGTRKKKFRGIADHDRSKEIFTDLITDQPIKNLSTKSDQSSKIFTDLKNISKIFTNHKNFTILIIIAKFSLFTNIFAKFSPRLQKLCKIFIDFKFFDKIWSFSLCDKLCDKIFRILFWWCKN